MGPLDEGPINKTGSLANTMNSRNKNKTCEKKNTGLMGEWLLSLLVKLNYIEGFFLVVFRTNF